MKKALCLPPISMKDMRRIPVLDHMKTMLRLLPLSLALCLCGCGPGYNFSPFMGAQQNWTMGPGGYVRVVDRVPLFAPGQFPSRPYIILGAVSTDNEHNLAKAAREQQADAVLLASESSYRSGSIAWAAPGVYGVTPIRHTVITANLIRYR
jgi:hypothetical protein